MIVKFLSSCRASVSSRVWKTLTRFSFTSQTTPGISGLGGAWNMPRVRGGCRKEIAGRSRISSISYRPFLKTYPALLTLQPWLMVSIHDAFMLG